MLAWLRNVNIAIMVSHVSWNVLTSSTLLAQPCICTIVLNGQVLSFSSKCKSRCFMAFRPSTRPFLYCIVSVYSTWTHFLEFIGIINFGAFCWRRHCMAMSHSPCSLPSCLLQKCHRLVGPECRSTDHLSVLPVNLLAQEASLILWNSNF